MAMSMTESCENCRFFHEVYRRTEEDKREFERWAKKPIPDPENDVNGRCRRHAPGVEIGVGVDPQWGYKPEGRHSHTVTAFPEVWGHWWCGDYERAS